MTEITVFKTPSGALIAADEQSAALIAKMKTGDGVRLSMVKQRNIGYHKKYFALLNLAFNSWQPEDKTYAGQKIEKNFDQFRNDITVLAGYYDTSITLKGDVRLIAKSISFAKMSQDDFENLYSSTINVILSRILTKYSREDLDNVIDQILSFA